MMGRTLISRSLGRKLAVTFIAVVGFLLMYEASMFDLRQVGPAGVVDPTLPAAGARLVFTATAYCKGTTTAAGVKVRTGIAASDPSILPVGSVVNVSTHNTKYNGVYTIMDTGPKVQGRELDLYMWSCHEALAFGRRLVELNVLRLGWNPSASTPSFIDRLFRRRDAARITPPVEQPAQAPNAAGNDDGVKGTTADFEDVPETGTESPATASSSDIAVGASGPTSTPVLPATPAASVASTPQTSNTP
ncbi:MAG TPA: 3D domain-containing protein [Vicinamibacterales bacterium]